MPVSQSQTLIAKIRAARETSVTVDGRRYTVRRPTDAEALELAGVGGLELVRRFVTGWDLREIDLIPGGSPEPVEFDPLLWEVWIQDQPHLWAPLTEAILQAYQEHNRARDDAAKN